jgi:DNA-binding response OmpR family regulator
MQSATPSPAVPRSAAPAAGDSIIPEPTRIRSLEGQWSPAKRQMPLMRLPGAAIAVAGLSDGAWQAMNAALAHDLTTVARYPSVAELLKGQRPDIVVLARDVVHDGAVEVRRLRQRWLTCLIIVVGARDAQDAEQLLDIGADEAVAADDPLLMARIRAAARRARTVNAGMRIAIGDIIFDRECRRVWCAGEEVHLTRTEEALLDCLFWYAPRPASVAELTAFAWGGTDMPERPNLVQVYIGYLRKKLSGSQQVVIRTVRRTGYEFAERVVEAAG